MAYSDQLQQIIEILGALTGGGAHLQGGLTVNVEQVIFNVSISPPVPAGPAVKAVITLGGSNMPGKITLDEQNENATLGFVDRSDEPTDAPVGATIVWSSDNTAVATVAADPSDASGMTGHVTPVAKGNCNILADVSGALEPDGTPFPQASVPLEVDPGAAVGERITLSV